MKKWTRWQDWTAVVVGLYAALSTFWTTQAGMSTVLMMTCGLLLVASGLVNLASPGMPAVEYIQAAIGLVLFLSPWIGSFAGQQAAAWTAWICGAIATVVTAAAIKPSNEAHRSVIPSH
jgi:hypothetical protein